MTIAEAESKVKYYSVAVDLRWRRYRQLEKKRSPQAANEYREYMSRWALLEKYKTELTILKMKAN